MNDITAVYYTANKIPDKFHHETDFTLDIALNGIERIDIEQPEGIEPSHIQIYSNALEGAKKATTKYVAFCEDDVLYHWSHFLKRPKDDDAFAYNMNVWSIYTWEKPAIFSYKDRINLSGLICRRELFIEAMEERFAKVDLKTLNLGNWAEPGKYEKNIGVTERKIEKFYSDMPLVAFSHETALSFQNLGKRKKLGQPRAFEIPYWGKAEDVLKLYE